MIMTYVHRIALSLLFCLFAAQPLRAQIVAQPEDSINLEAFELFKKGLQIYPKDQKAALPFLEQAAAAYLSSGVLSRYLELANLLLYTKHTLGKSYEALQKAESDLERFYDKALKAANPKHLLAISQLLNNMAILYQERGSYQKALYYLERSLVLNERLPEAMAYLKPQGRADVLNNRGLIYKKIEQYDAAIKELEQALVLFEQIEQAAREGKLRADVLESYQEWQYPARTRVNLAQVHDQKGNSTKAIELLKEAEGLYLQTKSTQSSTLNDLYLSFAQVFARQDKSQEVKRYAQKVLNSSGDLAPEDHERHRSRAYLILANEYQNAGQLDSAKYFCEKSFKINNAPLQEAHSPLPIPQIEADLLWQLSDYNSFVENLEVLILLAREVYTEEPTEAHQKAFLAACTALDDFFVRVKQQQTTGADKLVFFRKAEQAYAIAVESLVYLHEKKPDEAYLNRILRYMERSKSILLSESFKETEASAFAGMPRQLIDDKNRRKGQINELQKQRFLAKQSGNSEAVQALEGQLLKAQNAFLEFQDSLRKIYPTFFVLKANSTPPSIKELQAELSSDQLLLEYLVTRKGITVLSISSEQAHVAELAYPADSLARAVKRFRGRLSNIKAFSEDGERAREELRHYGEHFYEQLLQASLEAHNPEGLQRLYVIPDGVLSYLPFESFLIGSAREVALHKWPYVLRKYAVAYGFSASIWLDQRQQERQQGGGRLLGIAPKYDEGTPSLAASRSAALRSVRDLLGDLPGAREEVTQLEEDFQGLYLLNDAATESRFRDTMNAFSVIHLAMHGLLNDEEPMISSLIFTENGDSLNDNFLHAYEIANMDLNAQLVVLSACETGIGELQKGEGVMSLGRSFMYAGTPSLVYSLWKVNDKATTKLMRYFYENLSDGAPIEVCLQYAKRRYLDEAEGLESHPFYWAGFAPLGDTRPVELDLKRSTATWYWALGAAALLIIVLAVLTNKRKG